MPQASKGVHNPSEYLCFPDFPLQTLTSGDARCIYSGQNLTLYKMMTRVLTTKNFPREIHNSQSLRTPGHPGNTPPSRRHPWSGVASTVRSRIQSPESHTPPRPLSLQGLSCPEGSSSEHEAPTNRSSMIYINIYATLPSPTFITCNAPISASSYDLWIPSMQT